VLENLFKQPVVLADGRVAQADENYLRESILYPSSKVVAGYDNIMPTFKGEIDEEEMVQLIAFIAALKRGETPDRVESYPPPATTPTIED
jgi:cytochrome c oxidase subunit II